MGMGFGKDGRGKTAVDFWERKGEGEGLGG